MAGKLNACTPLTGGRSAFHDLGDDDTIACMTELMHKGFMSAEGLDPGQWRLTSEAVDEFIEHPVWLSVPSSGQGQVFAPRKGLALDECTQLELALLLNQDGWTQMSLHDHEASARVPLTPGHTQQTWYCDRHGRYFSNYLVCLIKAQQLFQAGLKELHHGQIEAYYSALLAALAAGASATLSSLTPWKPVPWTKLPNHKWWRVSQSLSGLN